MFWEAVILLIASYVISYALAPKAQTPPPDAIQTLDLPQAEEGTPQCVIFGDVWIDDWTIIAEGNQRTTEIRKDAGGGKK